jgi:uncharacterized delta-60 repeat protein
VKRLDASGRKTLVAVLAVAAAAFVPLALGSSEGVPGSLALSFGDQGTVVTPVGKFDASAFAIKVLPNGKLIALGRVAKNQDSTTDDFLLARYQRSGKLDPAFGSDGLVQTDFGRDYAAGFALALQRDGKIIAAGDNGYSHPKPYCGFALARYLPKGQLDPRFGDGGKVTTDFGTVRSCAVIRAVAVQRNGKIVAAGYNANLYDGFLIARYLPSGSLDRSFGRSGIVHTRFDICSCEADALALQSNGMILVGGSGSPKDEAGGFALVRYRRNGSRDPSFGDHHGEVFTAFGTARDNQSYISGLALQPNGMIVAAGTSWHPNYAGGGPSNFALARYKRSGTLDHTFGSRGTRETRIPGGDGYAQADGVVRQPDGSIIVAGSSATYTAGRDFAVARYLPNGSLDPDFGTVTTDIAGGNDYAWGLIIQPGGRIVLAGQSNARGKVTDRLALAGYSRGPLRCLVPPTAGKPLVAARRLLRRGRCLVGRIWRRTSPGIGGGRVISERPKAGRTLPHGGRVNLVVSKGKRR